MPIHNNIPPSWHNVIHIPAYLHSIIDISRRRYASAYNYKSDRHNQGTASLHVQEKSQVFESAWLPYGAI